MRIRCENCGAKYSISEDLLKKKVTKFRCKKCQHIMVVRASASEADLPSQPVDVEMSSQASQPAMSASVSADHLEDSTHIGASPPTSQPIADPSTANYAESQAAHYGENDPGYIDSSDTLQGHYPPSTPSQEADLYAGLDTSATPHHFAQNEQMRQTEQALDDEFEQAFQEQEEATQVRKAPSYPEIAPNHQVQALVPLSQAAAEAKEVEDVDTKVFSIDALETLRKERKTAQQQREEELRSKRAVVPAGGTASSSRWHSSEEAPAATPAPPSNPEWYIILDEQQVGPLTFAEIKTRIKDGEITADTDIWKEGFSDWRKISAVPTFMAALNAGSAIAEPGAAPTPPPPPSPSSGSLPSRPTLSASPVSKSNGGASGGLSLSPSPSNPGDLFSLADREMTNITRKAPSSTAALLQEPDPAATPAGPAYPTGAYAPFGPASPSLTGTFQPTGAYPSSTFNTSLIDKKDSSSTMKWVIGIGVTVLVLLLGGGGILFYYMFNQLKQQRQTPPQAQQTRLPSPPAQPSATQSVVQKIAMAPNRRVTPSGAGAGNSNVVVPAAPDARQNVEPRRDVEPRREAPAPRVVKRAPPPRRTRRSRRRVRRRRARRSRRRARKRRTVARYVPPRRSSSGSSIEPPPPPPPGGGDAPPPPPPPPGGGDAPPLPGTGSDKPAKRGTGLNDNELGSILGAPKSGGRTPRRAAPRPRRSLPSTLRKSQVASVIQNKAHTITTCQENHGSGIKSITASWVIQRSGRPNSIRVRGASGRFASCVRKAISRWRFPRFSGDPIDITGVPFMF